MENKLPNNWNECKFGDVAKIQNGYAFATKDFRHDGGVPLIKQSQLGGDKIELKNCVYLHESFLEKKKDFVLKKGDILIGMSGSIGKICLYDLDFPAMQNQRTGKAVPLSETLINKKLFWYFLSTVEQVLLDVGKGMGVTNISAEDIENLTFNLPPLAEQNRIVAKLDTVMQKLDSNKNRLSKVAQFEYKIFLKNIFDGHEFFDALKLGNCCEEQTKSIGKDWAKYRLIGVSKDNGVVDLRTGGKKTFERYKIVKPGWFLYNPMRVDIGSIAIWDGNDVAITSPDYVVFSISDSISPSMLLKFLKSSYGLSEINNNTQGAVRSRLYFRNLAKINFPFSGEKNHKNAELLFKGFNKLSKRKNHIDKLIDKLQQSILEKAFRGELVPQDPNDEPASVLLERIKKEKEKLHLRKTKKQSK